MRAGYRRGPAGECVSNSLAKRTTTADRVGRKQIKKRKRIRIGGLLVCYSYSRGVPRNDRATLHLRRIERCGRGGRARAGTVGHPHGRPVRLLFGDLRIARGRLSSAGRLSHRLTRRRHLGFARHADSAHRRWTLDAHGRRALQCRRTGSCGWLARCKRNALIQSLSGDLR